MTFTNSFDVTDQSVSRRDASALPVSVVYLLLQRYIISGLTVGGVKG